MAGALRFLTATQVQRLHGIKVIAGGVPSQLSLLESAVQSPMDIKHYENQTDVFQLAARLSEKIMRNHAFNDGNKRTALVAADMFLKINGYQLQRVPFQQDSVNTGIAQAHVAVVTYQWTPEQLGNYYRSIAKKIDSDQVGLPEIVYFRNGAVVY